MWIKNAWYMAAWSSEISSKPFARTYLNTPVVLFRQQSNNAIAALMDRCPHRFAPLSMGCVEDDKIACPYHGLEFNREGKCVHNPLGRRPDTQIQSFPIHEQDDIVWIWTGDREADPVSTIPRVKFRTDPAFRPVTGVTLTKGDYRLIVDNLMDLSHTHSVHPSFGGKEYVPVINSWENEDGSIVQDHFVEKMEEYLQIEGVKYCSHRDVVTWFKPATHLLVSTTTADNGQVISKSPSAHILTPESKKSTHYFWSYGNAVDSGKSDDHIYSMLNSAFVEEDKPVIEAIQARMGDAELMDMKPALMRNDAGPMRVRKKYQKLIKEEAGDH